MTETLALHKRATHADGRAVYLAVIARLQEAGWARQAVDTLTRRDNCWQIRHHYSAGIWELHFELQPHWRIDGPTAGRTSVPMTLDSRMARIDRARPLPSSAAVLAQLFGPCHAVCTSPVPITNGNADPAVKSVGA